MAGVRPLVTDPSGVPSRKSLPGDLLLGGENINAGAITTVGAGALTGAALASGIVFRSGPTAAFTDTFATALDILLAIGGNAVADVSPGTTFRVLYRNGVAFAMTPAYGAGTVAGGGTLTVAASLWREYLFTVLSNQTSMTITGTLVSASAIVVFALPAGVSALPIGPAPGAANLQPGATVTGTGVATATTVNSVTQGQGGVTGIIMSGTATASGTVPLTFGPTVLIDGLRSGTT